MSAELASASEPAVEVGIGLLSARGSPAGVGGARHVCAALGHRYRRELPGSYSYDAGVGREVDQGLPVGVEDHAADV
jgi:hypothetical protein